MFIRLIALTLLATQLSACVLTPRVEFDGGISFDAPMPSQQGMSYNDYLCTVTV